MAGLMDVLLAFVGALCGGSAAQEEPTEYQKPEVERPSYQQPTTRPEYLRIRPEHHQKQEPRPRPEYKPYQKPEVERPPYQRPTTRPEHPQIRPEHREQEPKSRLEHKPHQDQNQVNQHDQYYMPLRAKANEHGDLMARCFQESHEAYSRGDRALAKELSEKGKQHERTMESLNAEASAWIFRQNNLDSKPGEIDLHGLYVKEAISYVEKGIQEAQQRRDPEIRFIVGKGLHSSGHVAKIKPAIEDLMQKYRIPTEVDSGNAGVLIARLR